MATAEPEVPVTEQPLAVEEPKLAEKPVKEKKPKVPEEKKPKVPKEKKPKQPKTAAHPPYFQVFSYPLILIC